MDIKTEIEIKDELLESKEDNILSAHFSDQVLRFEEIQEKDCYEEINVKSEIEIKDEHLYVAEEENLNMVEVNDDPLYIEEKSTQKDEIFKQSSMGLLQNQSLISDDNKVGNNIKAKKSSRTKPQTSATYQKKNNKNNSQNLSCKFCNLNFKNNDMLKNHLLLHKKQFKCDYCNYESNLKSVLKRHMLTHRNMNLFKCSECNYECSQKKSLKTHLLKHGDKNVFKCSECNYECKNYKGTLKRHMLLQHENIKF